ncbi:MAG: hypothetical protein KGY50_04605, partial [Candidatus Thermoplasmatota archaeon]|nr:hypothetical protein [Candidatus Thermoplasmatota archaeon]
PRITHVETEKQVIEKLTNEHFDLILLFNKPPDSKIDDFNKKIKDKTDVPVVLLDNKISEISQIAKDPEVKIDKFFTWNGDGKIILSIVQYFEDKKNLREYPTDFKKCILIVEDSVQHYSSYLEIMHDELCNFLDQVITKNLNCEQKNLRFKRRPFIIHMEDYDKAISFFEEYKNNLLFIITDNYLEKNGERKQIGFDLAKKAENEKPDLPVLVQSSDHFKKEIKSDKIKFISKSSNTLMNSLRKFIRKNIGTTNVVFRDKKGRKVQTVKTISGLKSALNSVDEKSILKCAINNDFSRWFESLGEFEVAERCSKVERESSDGEVLRTQLMDIIEDYYYSVNQAAVSSFSQKIDDPYVKLTRIGKGALGGKARGIAFLAKLISKYISEDMFPELKITIPRSIVLSTDVFDNFMNRNNLSELDFNLISDERISSKFIDSSLPATILGDLRSFIKNTRKALIVRSSGMLEDSLNQPFAGIYASMLLANDSWEADLRFQEVCNAVKHVYGSTYFEEARSYIKSTPKHLGDEKMAVLIQEVVGERHGKYFYPTISGVAKSYNYYPQGPCKPEEGIVYLALGLGKSIVDGGSSFAFCPEKPKAPLFGTPKDYIKFSQNSFYALNLRSIYRFVNYNEETSLEKLDLDIAKNHGVLDKVVSTYIMEDDRLYPGIYENGSLVVDFAPVVNYNEYPLSKALKLLLNISEIALGYPVEIEFAVNIPKNDSDPAELVILQIRNMIPPEKRIDVDIKEISDENVYLKSKNVLGHGIVKDVSDIVFVDQEKFDLSNSNQVVNQIKNMNDKLVEKNIPYILIGPGRWGSSDPWLGIPVIWSNIAGAKAIVETPYKERPIDPSQGSHFFHDMIAAQVVYMITKKPEDIYWDWIKKQKKVDETEFIKHVKTKKPLQVIVDGKNGEGVIVDKKTLESINKKMED